MPFMPMTCSSSLLMGLADGPTEVHKVTVARQVTSQYQPAPDVFPPRHIPRQREAVLAKYADVFAPPTTARRRL